MPRRLHKKNPLISIIMNCHNGEKYLIQSLNSIIKQSYKNWELIFYNNFSFDKSKNIIKNKFNDKRIKYFESKKFLNLYDARNQAIKKSKGDYICFLDTDDTWNKNKLKLQTKFLKKNNCDVLYSKFTVYDQKKNKRYINRKYKLLSGNLTQSFLDDYSLGILTAIVKKSIFKKFKFDKRYNIIGDFDFFLRISMKHKIYVINKSLATYRYHGQNLSIKKINLYVKEHNFWFKKNKLKLKNFSLKKMKLRLFNLKIKKFLNKILGV